ncbi:hypothetical protein GYMLUDRAFT_246160 [Collybiopsis luxurians FD-317 M1]|uniref:Unplaced genomic scaffold GYMLUscaffold_37, whole genome shotgun sequence n=1 Tax=Collybiopsis luxurians FD-317 M1 TaxID=944289 RepID=A0A0D0B559_9AGAR|nr:hypothetical protein GYMLUDRAFT_246160 [Collybiopsis luxurians FD-317 M1]
MSVDNELLPLPLVVEGLDLEEQQQCLKWDRDHLGQHLTNLQQLKTKESAVSLCRRIEIWLQAQHLLVPAACILRNRVISSTSTATKIPLFLPSAVVHAGGACPPHLLELKWKLRFTKGIDALETLHKYLLSRTAIIKYKIDHTHGQYEGSRSSKALATVNAKIGAGVAKYRIHQAVVSELAGPKHLNLVETDAIFKVLRDRDVCGIEKDAMDAELEGDVSLSWIWVNDMINPNDQETISECFHIAWCKSRARAHCWQEEGLLIQEEMRHTLETFESVTRDWEHKAWRGACVQKSEGQQPMQVGYLADNEEFAQGRVAYAHKQAVIRQKIHDFCAAKWTPALEKLTSGLGAISLMEDKWIFA